MPAIAGYLAGIPRGRRRESGLAGFVLPGKGSVVKSFENKVAAITGAGSGIGRALAIELGRQKCDVPSQSAYNSAKFAVRGFTESLRQELDMMSFGVSASSVHPGGIKTGIARSSRIDSSVRDLGINDIDSREKFEKTFITGADKAARVILDGVRRNQRRILVGPDARVFDWVVRLLPSTYQRITTGYSKFSAK